MLVSLIRTIILYIVIVFVIRLMGKRQLGELQPTELIITILISNIATLPLENNDTPLFMGLIPIITLVILEIIISQLTITFPRFARIITGKNAVIINKGKIDQKKLKELRISANDLLLQLRQQQIFDINNVNLAIVETTGKISVYEKNLDYSKTVQNSMGSDLKSNDMPPIPLIIDGLINIENIALAQITIEWLYTQLYNRNISINNILILTINSNKVLNIILKQ